MNDAPRRKPDDPGDPGDRADPADSPGSAEADAAGAADESNDRRAATDVERPDDGASERAAPLPASAAEERHAGAPVEGDESIAGEEDPGAALDDGTDGRSRNDRSAP